MKVRVLGASGGLVPGHLLTSFRIGEDTIMDAGSMAEALSLEEQVAIDHILLTHAHLDHAGTLPFFVDNVFGMRSEPFVVHAIPETLKSVRDHLFNNEIWPDFSMIPDFKRASMRFSDLVTELPTQVGRLEVTAVRVNHTVPSVGFIIDDGQSSILFSGDTAPTEQLWRVANRKTNLRAAFIETSFPNRMQAIADASAHYTPQTLKAEFSKLQHRVPVYIYHIKPRFFGEVVTELKAIGHGDLHVVEAGNDYDFT